MRTRVCMCVLDESRDRGGGCLAGAFTTRRGLGGSPCTSPCDHREETGLIPGGRRRYIRIEWSARAVIVHVRPATAAAAVYTV